MTRYLLDTNICIRHLNQRATGVMRRLQTLSDDEVVVCSVVKAELHFGAMKSQMPEAKLLNQQKFVERFESLPFDDSAAEIYGRIRTELEHAGTPIGPNDLMIASIALANDLILVTHNTREFQRVKGLSIEDWEIEN